MSDATITFIVLGAAVVVFVWDQLPVAIVAVGVALALWATGVLGLDVALGGFGDPTGPRCRARVVNAQRPVWAAAWNHITEGTSRWRAVPSWLRRRCRRRRPRAA